MSVLLLLLFFAPCFVLFVVVVFCSILSALVFLLFCVLRFVCDLFCLAVWVRVCYECFVCNSVFGVSFGCGFGAVLAFVPSMVLLRF